MGVVRGYVESQRPQMLKSVEGVYRDGKIELLELRPQMLKER